MSERKNYTAASGKKAGKRIVQGQFFSLDFFKRNAVYIIALVIMALTYIANKYVCQRSMEEVMSVSESVQSFWKCRGVRLLCAFVPSAPSTILSLISLFIVQAALWFR